MKKYLLVIILSFSLFVTLAYAAYQSIMIVDRAGDQIQVTDDGALLITF